MAYGFGGGLAAGFGQGVELGNQSNETKVKREALMQQQIDKRIEMANGQFNATMKGLQETVAASPQRDAKVETIISSVGEAVDELANGVGALGPSGDQARKAMLSLKGQIFASLQTQSEATTAAQTASRNRAAQIAGIDLSSITPGVPELPNQAQGQPQQGGPSPMAPRMYGADGGLGGDPSLGGQPADGATPGGMPPMGMSPSMQESGGQGGMAPPPQGMAQPPQAPAEPQQAPPLAGSFADFYQRLESAGADPAKLALFKRSYMQDQGIDPSEMEKEMGKQVGKDKAEQYAKTAESIKALPQVDRLQTLVRQGIFTGFGAETVLKAARARVAAGGGDKELKAKIDRTQEYQNNVVVFSTKLLQEFGAGTGLSDADFANALKGSAGDITQEEGAIMSTLQQLKEARVRGILAFNEQNPEYALKFKQEGPLGPPQQSNINKSTMDWARARAKSILATTAPDSEEQKTAFKELFGQVQASGGAPSGGGPNKSAVEGGYRFKGSNPKDENNWELIQ